MGVNVGEQLQIRRRRRWVALCHQAVHKDATEILVTSEFAEDNVVIVCDGIWSRELAKPNKERDWEHVKAKLIEVEETAKEIDFPLIEAAAIRGRIFVTAEFEEHLDIALKLSSSALATITNDTARLPPAKTPAVRVFVFPGAGKLTRNALSDE